MDVIIAHALAYKQKKYTRLDQTRLDRTDRQTDRQANIKIIP